MMPGELPAARVPPLATSTVPVVPEPPSVPPLATDTAEPAMLPFTSRVPPDTAVAAVPA